MKRLLVIVMLLVLGISSYAPIAQADNPDTQTKIELMAFPFEGLNPGRPVAKSTRASVELMAFPFEGLNPGRPVAKSTTASVELMAFPFEGLNPGRPALACLMADSC